MNTNFPGFFEGTEMPTAGWWEALWPDPADVLKPNGLFAIVNWHQRPREETTVLGEPRGPRTELRLSPERTAEAVQRGGLNFSGLWTSRPTTTARSSRSHREMAPLPPLLDNKNPSSPSVFQPKALLREARRQKGIPAVEVPPVCILDPDGDIVRRLRRTGQAHRFEAWACYHTALDAFTLANQSVGIVGCAVGAPFAVLVAEQLFASGCRLLLSLTSAGQIIPAGTPPYFVIIDRALRDEGTSYHYAAPSDYAEAAPRLVSVAADAVNRQNLRAVIGSSWTTDAPFRETAEAIQAARSKGVLAVEMEAAALYTFAKTAGVDVLCLAHVTNTMAQAGQDFEKGEEGGTKDALQLLEAVIEAFAPR